MKIILAALFVVLTTPALAGDASFDCDEAQSLVEKTICADTNYVLAYRDGILGRLYASLKQAGGHDDVLEGQKSWLKSRDACKSDVDCLARRYDERIAILAEAGGDEDHLTGSYAYKNTEYDSNGELWLVRDPAGTLTGRLETVTGPNAHICDLEFDQAERHGNAWLWTDPDQDDEGNSCRVRLEGGASVFTLTSENCAIYCGVAGYFDDTYKRRK
jgi:uncharacterized protein